MMNQIFSPPLWISLLLSILSCTSLVGASCIQHFDTCIEALEDAECYYKHHDYDYCHHYKHYKYDNNFTIHYFKAFVDILAPQGEDFSRKKYAKNAEKHYDYCDKKSWWTSIDDCYGDSSYMCCSKLYKEPVYSAYEQIYNETRDQFESEFSLHDLFLHNSTHTVRNMCGEVQTLLNVCDDYLNIAFEVQYNVTSRKAATINEEIESFLNNTIANFSEVKSIRFINGNGNETHAPILVKASIDHKTQGKKQVKDYVQCKINSRDFDKSIGLISADAFTIESNNVTCNDHLI